MSLSNDYDLNKLGKLLQFWELCKNYNFGTHGGRLSVLWEKVMFVTIIFFSLIKMCVLSLFI